MSKSNIIISEWFHLYSNDVYNYLVYYTGSTDVEDLVQEVFIKVIMGLKSYKGQSSPKTWIISIARNVAIDDARKRNKKRNLSFDEQLISIDGDSPEKFFLQNEEKQALYNAIQMLKSNYREVILLRGIKDMTVSETAEILNWKEEKVRSTYSRALKSLRKLQGGDLNDEL
ncbi:RNA polymerase sigma factor [Bacillus sp. FJAT-49732]|uniref:RNA polymerase sigma factor n=1 Tax=Lederbergia citrisecunda TaxID=2833583 RepID=A0A942THE8_9BACI|nr:RNA polymerase sigma factor [Lederbergia citrisecunda]MBS4198116.1 RNA polymerase sigma factor [Lederbergia citrisecunda]